MQGCEEMCCSLWLVVNSSLPTGVASFILAAVGSSCAKLRYIPFVAMKSRMCTWDIPHAKEKGNFCYRF